MNPLVHQNNPCNGSEVKFMLEQLKRQKGDIFKRLNDLKKGKSPSKKEIVNLMNDFAKVANRENDLLMFYGLCWEWVAIQLYFKHFGINMESVLDQPTAFKPRANRCRVIKVNQVSARPRH